MGGFDMPAFDAPPIPPDSGVPLPLPVWVFKVLLLGTFGMHILAVDIGLGGSILVLILALRGRTSEPHRRIAEAAAWVLPLSAGLGRFGALIHAAGFDVGTALQPLQARDLFALLDNFLFQRGHLGQQHGHQVPQLGRRQFTEVGWQDHT